MAEIDNESSSNQKITWASLIPDLFYDLIGRVIPGCLFIIGLVYTLDKEIIFKLLENIQITINGLEIVIKPDPPYTFIFIVLLGSGYASALILSFIGDLLCSKFKTSQFKNFLEKFNVYGYMKYLVSFQTESIPKSPEESNNSTESKLVKELNIEDCEILFQIQHDYVKKKYRPQARSLSKSQAEVQLCLNTSAAFFVLFFIQIFRLAYLIKIGSLVIEKEFWQIMGSLALLLAIASISFFAAKYRNKRFLLRQFSFYAEIKKREENG